MLHNFLSTILWTVLEGKIALLVIDVHPRTPVQITRLTEQANTCFETTLRCMSRVYQGLTVPKSVRAAHCVLSHAKTHKV